MQVYPVFYILLLKLMLNPENAKDKATNINNKFKVDKILDQQTMKGQI
jgi:hypothetical protein